MVAALRFTHLPVIMNYIIFADLKMSSGGTEDPFWTSSRHHGLKQHIAE